MTSLLGFTEFGDLRSWAESQLMRLNHLCHFWKIAIMKYGPRPQNGWVMCATILQLNQLSLCYRMNTQECGFLQLKLLAGLGMKMRSVMLFRCLKIIMMRMFTCVTPDL